jgi:hypothetical protein
MLTLKVITTDQDGQTETHIFNGDVITHKEYFSEDHCLTSKKINDNASIWIVGKLIETTSTQKFVASDVFIYDEDRCIKNLLFVPPKADCYIMDNGKTIDSFFCQFEGDSNFKSKE